MASVVREKVQEAQTGADADIPMTVASNSSYEKRQAAICARLLPQINRKLVKQTVRQVYLARW